MSARKIVHVLGTALVGGTERQALMLLRGVDRGRFDCEVLLIRGGLLERDFAAVAPTRVLGKSGPVDPDFFTRLVGALRKSAPHLIHTWGSTANIWGTFAAKLLRIPVVTSERELGIWKGDLRSRLDAIIGRLSSRVVANCSAVAAACMSRGIDPDKISVIRNAAVIPPISYQSREKGLVLLLGRIDPWKGHDVLIDALPKVVSLVPEVHILIGGPAVLPEEIEFAVRLRGRVAEFGLGPLVEFRERVDDPEALVDRASIVVIPSRAEGLPNVLLEAMSRGTPVVASAVGGVPEVIEDQVSGLLVPPGDPEALAEALVLTLKNPDEAAKRAAKARLLVGREYSPQAMVDAWERTYEEVLG